MAPRKTSTEPKKPRKARKAAEPKATPAQPSPSPATSTFKKPPAEAVVKLVKRLANYKKDAQSIAGTIGEAIAKAVETQHFDKKALAMVRQLHAMSPERLAITLPHLLSYIDDLGLDKVADENRGLPINGEDDESGKVAGLSIVPRPMFEDDAA
jgi:hypothetical protein